MSVAVLSRPRRVTNQLGAVDRDNDVPTPDGGECAAGCDGEVGRRCLRGGVDKEYLTDLVAGGAATNDQGVFVRTQFPGVLKAYSWGGLFIAVSATFLELR